MQPRTKPLLLVVEDDSDIREIVIDTISNGSFDIVTKSNGHEGAQAAMDLMPDAVLTDITMPVMNGLQMIRQLRAQGFSNPIVILSAFGDRNNTAEALRLGVYDFVDKPFEAKDLVRVISCALDLGVKMNEFEKEWLELVQNSPELQKMSQPLLDKMKVIKKLRLMAPSKKAS